MNTYTVRFQFEEHGRRYLCDHNARTLDAHANNYGQAVRMAKTYLKNKYSWSCITAVTRATNNS